MCGCARCRAQLGGGAGGLRVTSPFGPRIDPVTGRAHVHTGVDLDGNTGDPIVASRAGRVVRIDLDGQGKGLINGNAITVRDPWGYQWAYLHLSRILVSPGAEVQAGQLLGLMGSTGRSTGSHLHLALRTPAGQYIDPLPYLRGT